MIDIKNKEDCVGCNACVQICPKHCIDMHEDEQGFLYPKVELKRCVNCNLCEKVCPVINQREPRKPIDLYAAKNIDQEIQYNSSSGGIFFALAKSVIEEGGVVFGARFDENWQVVHDYTDTIKGLNVFQRSKYVQSRIGECYKKAEYFLKEGRKVLFSGTPCQIAGLSLFLRKDFGEQLLKVDTACHGVPSPLVWKDFLQFISEKNEQKVEDIVDINFRDKRNGWDKYGMKILFGTDNNQREWYCPMSENIYMQGFLKDLYLRPSCYYCPAKCGKSQSDITLADFWGIKTWYPTLYEAKMFSLLIINNSKLYLDKSILEMREIPLHCAIKSNPALVRSSKYTNFSFLFWKDYAESGFAVLEKIINKCKPSKLNIISYYVKKILFRFVGPKMVRRIRNINCKG